MFSKCSPMSLNIHIPQPLWRLLSTSHQLSRAKIVSATYSINFQWFWGNEAKNNFPFFLFFCCNLLKFETSVILERVITSLCSLIFKLHSYIIPILPTRKIRMRMGFIPSTAQEGARAKLVFRWPDFQVAVVSFMDVTVDPASEGPGQLPTSHTLYSCTNLTSLYRRSPQGQGPWGPSL